MRYIQYFQYSVVDNTKLLEVCGDRGVIILDGRYRVSRAIEEGFECNGIRRPVYPAFQVFEGESFTRSKAVTPIIYTNNERVF